MKIQDSLLMYESIKLQILCKKICMICKYTNI